MNTYDIYLQGGQVVTVKSAIDYKQFCVNIFEGDERKDTFYFSRPRKMVIKKDAIIGVMDKTKDKEVEKRLVEKLAKSLDGKMKPYKPWEEEK
jgi:hypothetical protein